MTSATLRVAAISLVTLMMAGKAQAQERKGFMLGVHSIAAPGLKISGDGVNGDFGTSFGAGAGVTIGYGITQRISGFASLDLARQKTAPHDTPDGSWGLSHFEIGARGYIPLGASSMLPYVSGSYGRRALAAKATPEDGDSFDAVISGKMFAVGAGVERSFSPTMAVDAGVDVGFGKLDHFKAGDEKWDADVNATRSVRLRLGITWRPGSKR